MATTKREREEDLVWTVPLVDYKAIKARTAAAKEALDWRKLEGISEQLDEESDWMLFLSFEVERQAAELRIKCATAAVCEALEAAATSLPPGGAVATFNKRAVDELFKGPFGKKGESAFLCLSADIRVVGIPVEVMSSCKGIIKKASETYKEVTGIDEKWLDEPAVGTIHAAAKGAIAALLKSTPVKEVIQAGIQAGKEPEYDGEGLPENEFLVTVPVAVYFIFARPEGGWPSLFSSH
jgi:hypothetical protein